MEKILVLGNSSQINDIEFDKLQSDITTLGVNRIWYKHMPDILGFTDISIFKELEQQNINIEKAFNQIWVAKNRRPLHVVSCVF